jgi:hypothetical protein
MQYSQSPPLAEASDLDALSEQRIGQRPGKSSIHSPRSFRDDQFVSRRPSLGRRMLRALTRFFITVLIGVGATLGWQAYGDEARDMAIAQAPTLAWLLSIVPTTKPAAAMAATSRAPAQQLEPLAFNLDAVRRSVEQLAAKQDQMAQNIAALQAVEEDIRQKMSSAPPSLFQPAAPIPPPKPPQPRAQSPAAQSSSAPRPAPPAGPVLPSR